LICFSAKMVASKKEAPEPPEGSRELPPGPVATAVIHETEDSDDDMDYYEGYEPLPLAPIDEGDLAMWNSRLMSSDSEDDEVKLLINIFSIRHLRLIIQMETAEPPEEAAIAPTETANDSVPFIESVDREVAREVWTAPREEPNIDMNPEKAQEVLSYLF
jgi:hypothetical protein